MMTSILLGIISSTVAEVVTWINKRLSGTVLKGNGAFLLAFVTAFCGAAIKEVTAPGFSLATLHDWNTLSQTFGQIFTVSQLYFTFVVKKLNLDVTGPKTLSGPASL
jgi:hypothetical protein